MSRTNHQITGARLSINLTVDNDRREFLVSPLRDVDLSELDLWLQSVYVAQSLKDPKANRDEVLRIAETLTAFAGSGAEMLKCNDGFARYFWQSIFRSHPDVSFEKCREIMKLEENQKKFWETYETLNYVSKALLPKETGKVKADKGPIYCALAAMYKYTFEEIANMTPLQQLIAFSRGEQGTTQAYFATEEDLMRWQANRKKE